MNEWANSVAMHLWQTTCFIAFIAVLALAYRRGPARVRYGIWLAASVKFLIPFSLLVSIGSQFPKPAAVEPQHVRVVSPTERVDQIFVSLPMTAQTSSTPEVNSDFLVIVAGTVWFGGFAAVILSWARRWTRIAHAVRTAAPVDLGIGIPALVSESFAEPAVFGIRRPLLLLPAGMETRLAPAEYAAVVAHEICHVKRRDNLTQLLHMAVEAIFWFHPLVWWIGAQLLEERERACDEYVLSGGSRAEDYAGGILKICERCVENSVPCMAGASGSNLTRRIEQIMIWRASTLSATGKALLVGSGVVLLCGPIAMGLLVPRTMPAQVAAAGGPRFEVASIRQCKDGSAGRGDQKMGAPGGSPKVSPGHLNTGCALLASKPPTAALIQRVYGRLGLGRPPALGSSVPISGGPEWLYSDYYVINAETSSLASEEMMEGTMLQALLEERFKLRVHHTSVPIPVYALTVAKGGPKLRAVAEASCTPPDYSTWPMPHLPPGKHYCVSRGAGGRKGPNTVIDQEISTVDYFTKLLSLVLDRPVVDKTGLKGTYSFQIEFLIDQSTPGVGPGFGPDVDVPPAGSIFSVIQQLGLKLEPARGERDTLVIDHVERPSEN